MVLIFLDVLVIVLYQYISKLSRLPSTVQRVQSIQWPSHCHSGVADDSMHAHVVQQPPLVIYILLLKQL
jgi:hypothetical protein